MLGDRPNTGHKFVQTTSDGDAQVSTWEDREDGSWRGDRPNRHKTLNANDDVYAVALVA